MKKILATIVLNLLIINPSLANDITDFQIANISLGDSLLKVVSKKTITKSRQYTYKDDKYYSVDIFKKFGEYDAIQFHLKKNDKQYIIYGLSGAFLYGPVGKYYPQSEKECGLKKDIIENDIENFFKNAKKKKNNFIGQKGYDPKVIRQETFFILKDGVVGLTCATWGKKAKKKNYIQDNLRVSILSKEFDDWMMSYAY
jgi:hypothetical protein